MGKVSRKEKISSDVVFIKNILRHATVKWSGRTDILRQNRKQVFVRFGLKGQRIFKFHWQCEKCTNWFDDVRKMEVDHIKEVGSFNGDWNDYINKMYPRPVQDHLQVLCGKCHLSKTKAYMNASLRFKRRK